jgi:transposase-like protein
MKEVKIEQEKEQFPNEFTAAFKRWLVREIKSGRMTISDALERFEFQSKAPRSLIKNWLSKYEQDLAVSLPLMTDKERAKVADLQKWLKELEKQLEHSQMKNIALETLIDVAEEQLKITIRKKAGAKQ